MDPKSPEIVISEKEIRETEEKGAKELDQKAATLFNTTVAIVMGEQPSQDDVRNAANLFADNPDLHESAPYKKRYQEHLDSHKYPDDFPSGSPLRDLKTPWIPLLRQLSKKP